MKVKFKRGDRVHFKFSRFLGPAVYWTVVVAKPDALGYIVVINRFGEYSIAHQDAFKEV